MRTRRSRVGGWAIAATLAVAAVLLYTIRYALLPFVFALAIAFVVEPVVARLEQRAGGRRWPGAILVYLVVVAVLAGTVFWLGKMLVADATALAKEAPQLLQNLLTSIFGPQGFSLFGQHYTPQAAITEAEKAISGALGIGVAAQAAGTGIAVVLGSFLLLVLMPYFMISGPRLSAGAIWLIPPERRRSVEGLLPKILPVLRRYLTGILLVVIYTAVVAWIGFGPVFGLPHAPLLAALVGILEIVPVIGPATSATLVALTGLRSGHVTGIVGLVAFVVFLRLSIDNLIGPLVLGQAARVHPVVVIFAFVSGAMLFGVIGLILAVPTAVCLKISLQHYYAEPIADRGESR